jgi:hypothetical protein
MILPPLGGVRLRSGINAAPAYWSTAASRTFAAKTFCWTLPVNGPMHLRAIKNGKLLCLTITLGFKCAHEP